MLFNFQKVFDLQIKFINFISRICFASYFLLLLFCIFSVSLVTMRHVFCDCKEDTYVIIRCTLPSHGSLSNSRNITMSQNIVWRNRSSHPFSQKQKYHIKKLYRKDAQHSECQWKTAQLYDWVYARLRESLQNNEGHVKKKRDCTRRRINIYIPAFM